MTLSHEQQCTFNMNTKGYWLQEVFLYNLLLHHCFEDNSCSFFVHHAAWLIHKCHASFNNTWGGEIMRFQLLFPTVALYLVHKKKSLKGVIKRLWWIIVMVEEYLGFAKVLCLIWTYLNMLAVLWKWIPHSETKHHVTKCSLILEPFTVRGKII